MSKLKKHFSDQRTAAARRCIPFLLSFQEWLQIWTDSGHLVERGRGIGRYCMARFGDAGAYRVGNVRIIRNEENRAEQIVSDDTRAKMRKAKLGTVQSETTKARRAAALVGRKDSAAVKELKRIVKLGSLNPTSKLTEREILLIRSSSEPQIVIAKQFGVSAGLICMIRKRQRWGHI